MFPMCFLRTITNFQKMLIIIFKKTLMITILSVINLIGGEGLVIVTNPYLYIWII